MKPTIKTFLFALVKFIYAVVIVIVPLLMLAVYAASVAYGGDGWGMRDWSHERLFWLAALPIIDRYSSYILDKITDDGE